MNSFRPAKLSTRNIIWALCVVCVKLFASRDRICEKTTLGFCTTIMRRLTLHSFFVTISAKTQRISFHNHHIRLISLRMTSSYSPNSKDHSRVSPRVSLRVSARILERVSARLLARIFAPKSLAKSLGSDPMHGSARLSPRLVFLRGRF